MAGRYSGSAQAAGFLNRPKQKNPRFKLGLERGSKRCGDRFRDYELTRRRLKFEPPALPRPW